MRKRLVVFSLLVLSLFAVKAQTIEGNNDCTYSKEIIIPFRWSPQGISKVKPPLNQTVFYSYRDQFSYWYKVIVKEDALLRFRVSAINDSDEYAVYVYQYNEADFCEKVFYRKIKSVKPSFFAGGKSVDDPYDLKEKSFAAKKDNVYYISVLNTSLNNCGHNFYLVDEKDTLYVKALHLPCKRDIATIEAKKPLLSTPKTQEVADLKIILTTPPAKKDSVKPVVANVVPTLVCRVVDAVKKTPVDAGVSISDQATNEPLELSMTGKGVWTATVAKEKMYRIKCTAFGYKNAVQSVTIDSVNNTFTVLMEPFKEGDNFVMKSIYFFPNTYALKKSSFEELQKLLQYLSNNKSVRIEIQGHTNGDHRIAKNKAYATLGEEWNYEGSAKTLSQKRAEVIKKYLEANGITEDRLEAKGYGGKSPIVKDPQTNEEGQLNIRVEVSILRS